MASLEQEHQAKASQLEQQQATRRQQLEQEAASRFQQLEQEHQQLKRTHAETHERNRQQSLQELEQIRQECNRLQQETQKDAERVRQEALSFRQSTQQQAKLSYCVAARKRQRSAGRQPLCRAVLGELDARLQEMAKVVIGGRRELVRLQNTDVELTQPEANENKTVSINRVRRSARRIKEARDGSRSA